MSNENEKFEEELRRKHEQERQRREEEQRRLNEQQKREQKNHSDDIGHYGRPVDERPVKDDD